MEIREKIVFILLFGLVLVSQLVFVVNFGENLAVNDPWYHNKLTEMTLQKQKILQTIPESVSSTQVAYPTLLYPFVASISLITGISSFDIFLMRGILTLILTGVLIFIISKRVSSKKYIPYLTSILYFSSGYALLRSTQSLPENYGLIFLALIVFLLEIKSNGFILALSFVALALFHVATIPVTLLLLAFYFVFSLKSKKTREFNKGKTLLAFVLVILLISPILPLLFSSVSGFASTYFGEQTQTTDSVNIDPYSGRLSGFNFVKYTTYFDIILLSLLVLGLCSLKYKLEFNKIKDKPVFWAVFLTSAIFTLLLFSDFIGQRFNLARTVAYLIIFYPLLIAYSLEKFPNKKVIMLLITFAVIIFAQVSISDKAVMSINERDRYFISYLNENYPDSIKFSYGGPYKTLLNNSEWSSPIIVEVFSSREESELTHLLIERYGQNKSFILVLSPPGYLMLKDRNPEFISFTESHLAYEYFGNRAYEIRT